MRNPFSSAPASGTAPDANAVRNDPASDLLLHAISSADTTKSSDSKPEFTTARIDEELARAGSPNAAEGQPEYKLYKRRFIGLAALCLMNIVVSWGWLTYAPVVTITTQFYGLGSETPVNWLSTVVLWAYVVATPLVLYLLHHYPLRPTLILSLFLLLLGSWLRYASTHTHSFPLLMAGQILLGLSQPFVLSSPPYYSSLHFSPTGRISATALASLSNPIGAALAQLINPFLATKASHIPNMTLIISIITTIASISVLLVPSRPPTPPSASAAVEKHPFQDSWHHIRHNPQFWVIAVMFWIYLGLFNACSTILAQLLQPAGYTADEAGITGAILIVVGLVASAVVSPIVDRTHAFVPFMRSVIPVVAASYIALVPVIEVGKEKAGLPGVMVVAAVMGGSSFSLLPVALELVSEVTWPVGAEWGSCILWVGGQVVGAVLIIGLDAMRGVGEGGDVGKGDGDRNEHGRVKGMRWASVLMAILAAVAVVGIIGLKKVKGRVGVDLVAR
ncbi:MFS general substrate transporter [Ascodesmis nigricans]|uniref:MFS general substrate transporter n=1 Tax=Ascodesmis nigricans TaxID=341454 RepID=A0A4S2N6N4_9PEZI|nr:MFS general substrate transporter [Ascodesmis nigricans]